MSDSSSLSHCKTDGKEDVSESTHTLSGILDTMANSMENIFNRCNDEKSEQLLTDYISSFVKFREHILQRVDNNVSLEKMIDYIESEMHAESSQNKSEEKVHFFVLYRTLLGTIEQILMNEEIEKCENAITNDLHSQSFIHIGGLCVNANNIRMIYWEEIKDEINLHIYYTVENKKLLFQGGINKNNIEVVERKIKQWCNWKQMLKLNNYMIPWKYILSVSKIRTNIELHVKDVVNPVKITLKTNSPKMLNWICSNINKHKE
jgi:hypothetical protein